MDKKSKFITIFMCIVTLSVLIIYNDLLNFMTKRLGFILFIFVNSPIALLEVYTRTRIICHNNDVVYYTIFFSQMIITWII